MSDSVTIDVDGEAVTRQPRQDRPEPQRAEAQVEISTDIAFADPDDLLAQSQRALEESEARARESDAKAQRAESNAAHARNQAAQANMARAGDRAAAVASSMESAKADQTSAKIALKVARDSGDMDAEIAAQEMLSSALYRYNQASGELNWLNEQGRQQPQQQQRPQPAGDGLSDAARQWIADHPQFNSDSVYRGVATAAHEQALKDGMAVDSPSYFRHIEAAVARFEQRRDAPQEKPMNGNGARPNGNGHTSSAAPSNRGGGSGGSRSGTVNTLLGPVSVADLTNGRMRIDIPPAARADWEEAASINKMTLGEYAYEQVKIARELAAGGNAGWVRGDGVTHQ